jgi:CO/xanthine dehydrogenase Mo-binding subunit
MISLTINGALSTAGVAGSLVNAVSAATGTRIYKLPIRLA